MKTYYCKKCGTANEIEETMEKFFCANCGTENSVPQKVSSDTASKPVSGDKPAENSSFIYGSVDMAASKEPDEKTEQNTAEPVQQPVYSYGEQNTASGSYTEPVSSKPVKVKKKKTGLIVTLVVLVAIIAAAVVLLITPVKSPLPIKFRCDDCNKIKYSEKYEVEYEDTGKVEERYICKDCFEENGYEEQ